MEKKILLQELFDAIAAHEHITKKKAEALVRAFFEVAEEGLSADNFVKIKGFGTFKIVAVSERESVNINTGERFQIDGHSKISFTPDNYLKELVNRPFSHFQTTVINEDTDLEELESVQDEPTPTEEIIISTTEKSNSSVVNAEEDSTLEEIAGTEETAKIEEATKEETAVIYEQEELTDTPIHFEEPEEIVAASLEPAVTSQENVTENDGACEPAQPLPQEEETPQDSQETKEDENLTATEAESIDAESEEESVTSEETEPQEMPKHKCKWCKTLLLSLIIVLLMAGSYFAGYFRILCPCEFTSMFNELVQPDTITTKSDSTPNIDSVQKEVEEKTIEANKVDKQNESPDAMPPSNQPEQASAQPEAISGNIQSSESSYNGKQVEGGKYIIIGTQESYTISKGETLRTIAERFWGSRGYAAYIIAHNDFANPDNVAAGTVIKIPRLKKASK